MLNAIVQIVLLLTSLIPLSQQAISCNVGTGSSVTPTPGCATVCQTASTYTTGTLGTTTYQCATSSTCPSNSISGVGTGTIYTCCSTTDCNTGDAALPTPISCNVGSSATSVTATAGCYTTLCQMASTYANSVLGVTAYTCSLTSTCPTNTTVSGTGIAYSCCSTANCNTGTVAITTSGISCNVGTKGGTVTATSGCTTNLCQTTSAYLLGSLISTIYSCALTSTCPTSTTVSGTGVTYSCCSTANCNDSYSTMRQAASSFGILTAAFLSFAKLNLF